MIPLTLFDIDLNTGAVYRHIFGNDRHDFGFHRLQLVRRHIGPVVDQDQLQAFLGSTAAACNSSLEHPAPECAHDHTPTYPPNSRMRRPIKPPLCSRFSIGISSPLSRRAMLRNASPARPTNSSPRFEPI